MEYTGAINIMCLEHQTAVSNMKFSIEMGEAMISIMFNIFEELSEQEKRFFNVSVMRSLKQSWVLTE